MTMGFPLLEDVARRARSGMRELRIQVRSAARHHAARLRRVTLPQVTYIGITGSAGKTTTRRLAMAILSTRGKCIGTPGTGNEHYEVERTVLDTTREHAFCVVEVSAGGPGYLDRSLRALRPDIGVLTLVAREHYSAFGSSEAIAAEKGKLIAALPPSGTAVLNIDDPLVRAIGERHAGRILWVGSGEGAALQLLDARSSWPEPLTLRVRFDGTIHEVRTRLHGTQLALSVLSALGVGLAAGIPLGDAIAALALVEPMQGRMSIESTDDGVVFVRDDWKAPHWSLEAPFEFMRTADAQRKVAVLGSISDSPKSPSQRYAAAVRQAFAAVDVVVLVGVDARGASKVAAGAGQSLHAFARIEDAARFLGEELRAGDLVLLKGTNKQDHLARLVLNRRRPVRCWAIDCGLPEFCSGCARLDVPSGQRGAPLNGSDTTQPQPSLPDAVSAARESGSPVTVPVPLFSTPVSIAPAIAPEAPAVAPREPSWLIVALGNPSTRHANTPHNVGYRVVDRFARAAGAHWDSQPEGRVSVVAIDGVVATLFKPAAAMNLTGPLVARFLVRTGRAAGDCIVVHDDMDFELGVARAKRNGGDGGHKGMRSIIAALGTDRIARVRVGVRPVGDLRKASALVLADFSDADEARLASGLDRAEAAIRDLLREFSRQPGAARAPRVVSRCSPP